MFSKGALLFLVLSCSVAVWCNCMKDIDGVPLSQSNTKHINFQLLESARSNTHLLLLLYKYFVSHWQDNQCGTESTESAREGWTLCCVFLFCFALIEQAKAIQTTCLSYWWFEMYNFTWHFLWISLVKPRIKYGIHFTN